MQPAFHHFYGFVFVKEKKKDSSIFMHENVALNAKESSWITR